MKCSECKRTPDKAGPITRGMCQYCAREKRCYVCGNDATTIGVAGMLCGAQDCAKTDEYRAYGDSF